MNEASVSFSIILQVKLCLLRTRSAVVAIEKNVSSRKDARGVIGARGWGGTESRAASCNTYRESKVASRLRLQGSVGVELWPRGFATGDAEKTTMNISINCEALRVNGDYTQRESRFPRSALASFKRQSHTIFRCNQRWK